MANEIHGPTDEPTHSVQGSLYDQGYVNAMSHFYRGELGRIMVWRTRLDTTTNWAVTSSTAIITIAFSNAGVPHLIFFFNLAIVWIMLWIEARRYRFYDAFRARVRMLEAHFLVPMVMENRHLLAGRMEETSLRRSDSALVQNQHARSGRAASETQLRLHFPSHHDRLDHENFPARQRTDRYVLARSIAPCGSGTFLRGSSRSFSSARW